MIIFFNSIACHHGLLGTRLVLESDGCDITEDEALDYFSKEVLIILQEDQCWLATEQQSSIPAKLNEPVVEFINEIICDKELPNEMFAYGVDGASTSSNVNNRENINTNVQTVRLTTPTERRDESHNNYALFDKFVIPFEDFPTDIKNVLLAKEKLGTKLNDMVQIIVKELRKISPFIPVSVFRLIGQKLANQYPETFKSSLTSDTNFGSSVIVSKLINHNNYLNRPGSNELMRDIPTNKRRKLRTIGETCVNWLPTTNDEKSISENESKRIQLLNQHVKGKLTNEEWLSVIENMKLTYDLQRAFLNKSPTTLEIIEDWPYLLKEECLLNHFEKLMDINLSMLKDNVNLKKSYILATGKSAKQKDIVNLFKNPTPYASTKLTDVIMFDYIFIHFKEDRKLIFDILKVNKYNKLTDIF